MTTAELDCPATIRTTVMSPLGSSFRKTAVPENPVAGPVVEGADGDPDPDTDAPPLRPLGSATNVACVPEPRVTAKTTPATSATMPTAAAIVAPITVPRERAFFGGAGLGGRGPRGCCCGYRGC